MDKICSQFLHVFWVKLGVILNNRFCKSILCYVYGRCVKGVSENEKKIKDSFKLFLYSVSYKIYASKFWQFVCKSICIRLILFNDFMKEEGP